MIKFLKRFFVRRKSVQVVRISETKLSLSEWRASSELVKLAHAVWQNPDFRLMVSCLKNENPAYFVLPDDANPSRSVALQRRAEGYNMAITNLEAMATLDSIGDMPEPTFQPEEINK